MKGVIVVNPKAAAGDTPEARASRVRTDSTEVGADAGVDAEGGTTGYSFLVEMLDPAERGLLIDIVHCQVWPPWLLKLANGQPLRPADEIARRRVLAALDRLSHAHSCWRNAKLPTMAAAE